MQTSNEAMTAIKSQIKGALSNVHTALPGNVVSFDSGSNRATVKPSGNFMIPDGRTMPYPDIYNVPVIFPTGAGGTAGITFPIVAGDAGLIVFSERQLEDFLHGGESEDPRMHDLNDAIFIPGLYSAGATSNAGDNASTVLTCGGSTVTINGSGITISAAGSSVTIGGGDLVCNGISLVHHTHGGIKPGDENTDEPN